MLPPCSGVLVFGRDVDLNLGGQQVIDLLDGVLHGTWPMDDSPALLKLLESSFMIVQFTDIRRYSDVSYIFALQSLGRKSCCSNLSYQGTKSMMVMIATSRCDNEYMLSECRTSKNFWQSSTTGTRPVAFGEAFIYI